MKYLPMLLLLTPLTVSAECFPDLLPLELPHRWCALCWERPIEREDNKPFPIAEQGDYMLEYLDNGVWNKYLGTIESTDTGIYWYSKVPCFDCSDLRIAATDLDLRQSIWAYPTCPPDNPIICQ